MKKRISIITLAIIAVASLSMTLQIVFAEGGSQGGSGGSGGSTGTGTSCSSPVDSGKSMPSTGTYLFDLVYKAPNSTSFKHIACAIIGNQATASNLKYDTDIHTNCKTYSLGSTANYQSLKNIAKYIENGGSIDNISSSINENSSTVAPIYMAELGVMDNGQVLSEFVSALNKTSTRPTDSDHSYGYRILIQKFVYFGCTGNWRKYIAPRKEASRSNVIGSSVTLIGGSYQSDLYSSYEDLGISKGSKLGSGATASKFKDKNDGTGYNIIWFDINDVPTAKYKCVYNESNSKCTIQVKKGNGSWQNYQTDVNCNSYNPSASYDSSKEYGSASSAVCPSVTYKCVDGDTSTTYGKCKIQQKVGSDSWTTVSTVNCNSYNDGTQTYDSSKTFTNQSSVICPYKPGYYYTDVVCENCDDITDSAYIVQDTNEWDGILSSTSVTKSNIKSYYIKSGKGTNCEIYCRDTFKVILPNADDSFNVASGRYFVVNHGEGTFNSSLNVPNFAPIKVERIRECRATAASGSTSLSTSQQTSCLNSYKDSNANSSKLKETGSITFTYTGKSDSGNEKYSLSAVLQTNSDRTYQETDISNENSLTSTSATKVLTISTTNYYELPDGLYSCIEPGTGNVFNGSGKTCASGYTYLGTSTIPISYNVLNTSDKTAGTITLAYELPTYNQSNSYISNAFKDASYLLDIKDENNIYSRFINSTANTLTTNLLKVSSCALMYGYNTSKSSSFYKCANARSDTTKMISICGGNKSSAVVTSGKTSSTIKNWDYICDFVYICPYGYDLCPDGSCPDSSGVCGNSCTYENDKCYEHTYDSSTGSLVTNEISCSTAKTKYPGTECDSSCPGCQPDLECKLVNKETNKCQLITKDSNGSVVNTADITCSDYIECKCQYDCEAGYCCPDTTMICPDYDSATGMWSCPGKGSTDIIYRVIDLDRPFPDQDASNRLTGANWCSYQYKTVNGKRTQVTSCSYDTKNYFVDKHIINNRSTSSYTIYQKDPLYEVTLSPDEIRNIRSYNKTTAYEDVSTLKYYNSSSTKYYSTFLNNTKYGTISGTCASDKNVDTCAES